MQIASDINAARPDQLIALDGHGNVTSMQRVTIRSLPLAVLAGVVVGTALALSTALGGVLGLPLVGAFLGGWVLYLQAARRIRRSAELIAQDRLDEAATEVARLERGFLPFPSLRAYAAGHAAAIAWRRGDLEAALAHTEKALPRRRGAARGPIHWMQLLNRVQLLASLRRLDEALRAYAEVARAPRGDWLEMERQFTELLLAFCREDAGTLPEDLHEWARAALRTNVFGGNLVLLAWAYERRGDPDMAAHLLAEAESRLERWHLDRTFPAVFRWMEDAQARLIRTPA